MLERLFIGVCVIDVFSKCDSEGNGFDINAEKFAEVDFQACLVGVFFNYLLSFVLVLMSESAAVATKLVLEADKLETDRSVNII